MQQLFSLEVSLAGIPILSNGLQFKAAVKSAQKIPYSSVGFGLGTWRAEKNTSNSQCLVNISKAERMVQEGGISTLWSLGSVSLAVCYLLWQHLLLQGLFWPCSLSKAHFTLTDHSVGSSRLFFFPNDSCKAMFLSSLCSLLSHAPQLA